VKPGRKCDGIATVGWKHHCARCGLWEDIGDSQEEADEWIRQKHARDEGRMKTVHAADLEFVTQDHTRCGLDEDAGTLSEADEVTVKPNPHAAHLGPGYRICPVCFPLHAGETT
jgi:hypothetical protein